MLPVSNDEFRYMGRVLTQQFFRSSSQMEMRVHSASVKIAGKDKTHLVPVFGEGDKVSGTITLDSKAPSSGRLVVTVRICAAILRYLPHLA